MRRPIRPVAAAAPYKVLHSFESLPEHPSAGLIQGSDGALYGVCEAQLAEMAFRRGTFRWKLMAGHGAERKLIATAETRPVDASPR